MEEARCKDLADAAQHDLDEALPALEEAVKVLIIPKSSMYTFCCLSPVEVSGV